MTQKYQSLEKSSIEYENYEFCHEIEGEIEKQMEIHKEMEDLYHANIEENEKSSEIQTNELEIIREKMRELGEIRDNMKKMLIAKDEKIGELEKTAKIVSLLIVKGREAKANIINSVFENRNCDIIVMLDQKKESL